MNNKLRFHALVEAEALRTQYGTITFNVFLKLGQPLLNTVNIVRQKRKKYKSGGICEMNRLSATPVKSF